MASRSWYLSKKICVGTQGARRATVAHLKAQHKPCWLLLTKFWCPLGLPRHAAPVNTLFGDSSKKALKEVLTASRTPEWANFNVTPWSIRCSGDNTPASEALLARSPLNRSLFVCLLPYLPTGSLGLTGSMACPAASVFDSLFCLVFQCNIAQTEGIHPVCGSSKKESSNTKLEKGVKKLSPAFLVLGTEPHLRILLQTYQVHGYTWNLSPAFLFNTFPLPQFVGSIPAKSQKKTRPQIYMDLRYIDPQARVLNSCFK